MFTKLDTLAGEKQFKAYPSGRHSLTYIEDLANASVRVLAAIEDAQESIGSMGLLRIASSSYPRC